MKDIIKHIRRYNTLYFTYAVIGSSSLLLIQLHIGDLTISPIIHGWMIVFVAICLFMMGRCHNKILNIIDGKLPKEPTLVDTLGKAKDQWGRK